MAFRVYQSGMSSRILYIVRLDARASYDIRSLAATAVFFTTGVVTTHLLHSDLPAASSIDWSFPQESKALLALQSIPFSLSVLLYFLVSHVYHPSKPLEPHLGLEFCETEWQ